jgi:hypothetical protein
MINNTYDLEDMSYNSVNDSISSFNYKESNMTINQEHQEYREHQTNSSETINTSKTFNTSRTFMHIGQDNPSNDILYNQSNIPLLSNNSLLNLKIKLSSFSLEFLNNIILNFLNFYVLVNYSDKIICAILLIINKAYILFLMTDNILFTNNEILISIVSIIVNKKKPIYIIIYIIINITSCLIVLLILSHFIIINDLSQIYSFMSFSYLNISIGSFIYYLFYIKNIYFVDQLHNRSEENNRFEENNDQSNIIKKIIICIQYGLFYLLFSFNGINSIIIYLYINYNNPYSYIYLSIILLSFGLALLINRMIINR